MTELTLDNVYEFLGIPNLFDQYAENGELPCWNCADSKKLDLQFGKPEFRDGLMIIRIPFSVEEIESTRDEHAS